jgi:threonine aldolase
VFFLDDFRSDTVTKPSNPMRSAMYNAEVGDAVYEDCPTTKRLELLIAELLGKDDAMFFPSGTQSNLVGLMVHCERGDELIVGDRAHIFRNEAGGASVLGSISMHSLPNGHDGTIPLADIRSAIKANDIHFPISRLLTLENTFNGACIPINYLSEFSQLARTRGLATHLDGARLMNAAVACEVAPSFLARFFDSVSLCLSKGLGAPVGSVLAGSSGYIQSAKRLRKLLGGGMRQTGVLAAAGIFAVENNIDRLYEDHLRAARLSRILSEFSFLDVELTPTNMVFTRVRYNVDSDAFIAYLASRGILVSTHYGTMRWVTHLDVDDDSLDRVQKACFDFSLS